MRKLSEINETYLREEPIREQDTKSEKVQRLEEFAHDKGKKAEIIKASRVKLVSYDSLLCLGYLFLKPDSRFVFARKSTKVKLGTYVKTTQNSQVVHF